MKKLIIIQIAFFVLVCNGLQAQILSNRFRRCLNCSATENGDNINTIYNYDTIEVYRDKDVTSDFGARYYPGYNWHKGVDYRPIEYAGTDDSGRGTSILALEPGEVSFIKGDGGFKYIVIDGVNDFGYGHIFCSKEVVVSDRNYLQSGKFLMALMNGSSNRYCIINKECNTGFGGVTGTATVEGTTYAITDTIENDEEIAPMGGSSGKTNIYHENDRFPVHLHLYQFRSLADPENPIHEAHETNCMNPLNIVNHTLPTFDVKIKTEGENFGTITFDYPGTSNQKIMIRALMNSLKNPINNNAVSETNTSPRYNNGVSNVNKVEFLIKKSTSSTYETMRGSNYESVINLGGTNNSILYPTYMANENMRGSFNKQGQASFAYDSYYGYPYDDYYFPNFYTRISQFDDMGSSPITFADLPVFARYNDGQYNLKARITNVRNNIYESAVLIRNLDNFKPYISRTTVKLDNQIIYVGNWAPVNDSPNINNDARIKYYIDETSNEGASGSLQIEVLTSEPINGSLKIASINPQLSPQVVKEKT